MTTMLRNIVSIKNVARFLTITLGSCNMKTSYIIASLPILLSGCATLFEGTSQEIQIVTNPPGANCVLLRKGEVIARVNPTPGAATIKKTKDDITVDCTMRGYQKSSYLNHSGADWVTAVDAVGGILVGGATWGIDSASGADNKYDGVVNISMSKK
jgi:hypothetical protein